MSVVGHRGVFRLNPDNIPEIAFSLPNLDIVKGTFHVEGFIPEHHFTVFDAHVATKDDELIIDSDSMTDWEAFGEVEKNPDNPDEPERTIVFPLPAIGTSLKGRFTTVQGYPNPQSGQPETDPKAPGGPVDSEFRISYLASGQSIKEPITIDGYGISLQWTNGPADPQKNEPEYPPAYLIVIAGYELLQNPNLRLRDENTVPEGVALLPISHVFYYIAVVREGNRDPENSDTGLTDWKNGSLAINLSETSKLNATFTPGDTNRDFYWQDVRRPNASQTQEDSKLILVEPLVDEGLWDETKMTFTIEAPSKRSIPLGHYFLCRQENVTSVADAAPAALGLSGEEYQLDKPNEKGY